MSRDRALDFVGTWARLGLAVVWLVSGGLKAVDPDQTYVAVRAYDVLPPAAVEVVAALLPWVELALGVLLLLGVGTRPAAIGVDRAAAGVRRRRDAGLGPRAVDRLRLLRRRRRGRPR